MSRRTIPTASIHSDAGINDSGHQASTSNRSAAMLVTQGNQQEQSQRAAHLRGCDDAAHRGVTDAKIPGKRIQQRLRVIHVGHVQATGCREEKHQASGQGRPLVHGEILVRRCRRNRYGAHGAQLCSVV